MGYISNYLSNSIVAGTDFMDNISNSGDNVSINAGAGYDTITLSTYGGKNVTVRGGAGNDSISNNGKGNLFEYSYGDGYDTINGFTSNDILRICNWSYTTMVSGNDFVVSVGAGSIVLKNAATIPVKIINQWGTLDTYNYYNTYDPSTVSYAANYATVISNNNANSTISGTTGNDDIYNYGDGAIIYGGNGHDDIHNLGNNVLISGGNGADSIESYYSNNGFIAGNAGNDTLIVQGAVNTLEGGTGNDVIILDPQYNNNAINYSLGDGYDTVYGFNSSDVLWIYETAWNMDRVGNDIIISLLNGSVTLKDAAGINPRIALNITDNSTGSSTILEGTEIIDASTRKNAIEIKCNELANEIYGGYGNDSLYGGAGNDIIYGNAGNDKIFGEAGDDILFDGNGNDTLTGGKGKDIFVYSAGKDIITDYATEDKISFSGKISKSTLSGSDVIFTVGKGSLTVKKGKGKTLNIIDPTGKEYSTVVGGQILTDNSKTKITLAADEIFANASTRKKAVTLTGNTLNNSIVGGKGNDLLNGGKGNDTLSGGTGNDSLTGGAGKDIFVYTAGKDVITDYAADDKISFGGKISKSTLSGSDVIFTVGKGSLTVKKGKGKTLNIIDSTGKEYSTVVGGTTLTLTDSATSPVTVDSTIKTINASKRTVATKITGNKLANTISGGSKNDSLYGGAGNDSLVGNAGNDKLYGGKGNDILIGGKGNDSLWGDAGADKFIYSSGDGKDFIYGFDNKDTLTLDNLDFKVSYKNEAVTFKMSGGSVTLKDFTATTFHVNNDIYKISGSKLKKQ